MPYLEKDPYYLRNAILDCLYTIVVQVLTKEGTELQKISRHSFLKKLQVFKIKVYK